MFPDDAAAEEWFIANRWPDGRRCSHCASSNAGREGKHPQMPLHCRDCRKFFSVKTGTVMQSSKLGYQKWALAIYLLARQIGGHFPQLLYFLQSGVPLGIIHNWHFS